MRAPAETRRDWLPILDVEVLAPAWEAYHRLHAERAAWSDRSLHAEPVGLPKGGEHVRLGPTREEVLDGLEVDVPVLAFGPLDELRAEHLRLVDAWTRATRCLDERRVDVATAGDNYRRAVRDAVRDGRDPVDVPAPASGEVAAALVGVLAEQEVDARCELAEFVPRALRALESHRVLFAWVRSAYQYVESQQKARPVREQSNRVILLTASLDNPQNALSAIGRWARSDEPVAESVAVAA